MSSQVRLPVLIFLVLGLKLFPSFIESQTVCLSDDGYYTPNSTYHTNLRALLSYLSTNIGTDGFYNDTLGQGSDIANAMVLCRADLQLHSCVNCLGNATERLFRACLNQRKASIFDDMCMVRYSHKPLEFSMQLDNRHWLCHHQKSLGHGQILKELRILLHKLGDQAASGDFVWKVGVGNIDASDFHRIYALVQCTPDISSEECNTCIMKLSVNKALGHGQILKELRILLHKLGDQAASGDFVWKVGVGNIDASDFHRIYALVQCTPDISSEECNTCIMKLSVNKALGHGQILKELGILLHKLGDQAASGDFVWKVGVGNIDASDFHRIYALVQCIPDISSEECNTCIMKLSVNVVEAVLEVVEAALEVVDLEDGRGVGGGGGVGDGAGGGAVVQVEELVENGYVER
ncbi:hypothetical protein RD792_002724 [Penstemon davidsonii]|uniref:Gnk2-homologous domain-containing protein n=1 Tax=Penstemon davidsonii TaxID=160366 RepID=A0ABR0DRU8_9LAMI|nr:hypothetical protein RD792_002724 [Penstemon davidsonii]